MKNPILDLQKSPASRDVSVEPFRHSGFSIKCKGTSTWSYRCY
ncbi:hypothetical protein [Lactobacillus panisapium]|nr:hypothetical protein [Lactobacillus panisapium]